MNSSKESIYLSVPFLICVLNVAALSASLPASMQLLILFSLHPFANVWSAVLKLHAVRFATHEKAHYVTIDYANVLQIENDLAQARLAFKKSPQLGDRRCFDPAA